MSKDTERNRYIGYEYKKILTNAEMAPVFADGYENFGWELDGTSPSLRLGPSYMTFKRDRKLRNKAELARLQRQFESCTANIISLEKSKTVNASIVAYIVGILGTALMAGATFAYLANLIPLMIILAVPGFVGWILPYFLFKKIYQKQAAKVVPLVDQKYDEIYSVCEKANQLLA